MKKEKVNNPSTPSKNIQNIMSSIEKKLQVLASDHFQLSYKEPFMNSSPSIISTPSKQQLQIQDLGVSSPSSVLNRIEYMEQHYISQITNLNNQLSLNEAQLINFKNQNRQLTSSLEKQKEKRIFLQQNQQKLLEKRIDEMKDRLLERMREQVSAEIQAYLNELSEMRKELNLQRKNLKQCEKELELVTLERDNFEELYREIILKYKEIVQADINKHQKERQNSIKSYEKIKIKSKQEKTVQVKKKKKTTKEDKNQAASISKEQLIPFLTKGIEQLKQKLKIS